MKKYTVIHMVNIGQNFYHPRKERVETDLSISKYIGKMSREYGWDIQMIFEGWPNELFDEMYKKKNPMNTDAIHPYEISN